MRYYYGAGYVQDGKLDNSCGRIVIYEDKALVGYNRAMDHNYLLRALASKYRFPREKVISNAIRLYYKFESAEGGRCIISGVRRIDNEEFDSNFKFYGKLVKDALK